MAAPMLAAIALAKNVLPVPGGPQKIMPRGISSSSRLISSASVGLVALREHVEDFGRQPLLHLRVAADVLVEIDVGTSSVPLSVACRTWA